MPALLCKEVRCPEEWSPMNNSFQPVLEQIPKTYPEYRLVVQKIHETIDLDITKIVRVQNPFLWGCYQLKKMEYSFRNIPFEEMALFHTTGSKNTVSIATDNLDWRRCKRGKFGQAVSFSPFAAYCDKQANWSSGNDRAIILCTVLIGRMTEGRYDMKIPPVPYDTSIGSLKRKINVYVKYDDYEFYPKYIAYYSRNPNYEFSSIPLNSNQQRNYGKVAVVGHKDNEKENKNAGLSSGRSTNTIISTSMPTRSNVQITSSNSGQYAYQTASTYGSQTSYTYSSPILPRSYTSVDQYYHDRTSSYSNRNNNYRPTNTVNRESAWNCTII